MKTHKKIFSGLFSLVLIASIGIGNVSAAPAKEFKDVPTSHWAHGDIQALTQLSVLSGYPNAMFMPQQNVTRAQASKIISLATGIEPVKTTKSSYKDVAANHWALPYIEALTAAGVLKGKSDGNFGPQDMLTRAQMAKILTESFGYKATSKNEFNDVKPNHWAYSYIMALRDNNITTGYTENNTYRPNGNVTRAQMAAFANRSLKWEAGEVTVPAPTPKPDPKPTPNPDDDPTGENTLIDDSLGTNPAPIEFPDIAKKDPYPESFTWLLLGLQEGHTDLFFNPNELPTGHVLALFDRVLATDKNNYNVVSHTAYAEGLINVKYAK